MTYEIQGQLITNENKSLDSRCIVSSINDVENIQKPYVGMIFSVYDEDAENGNGVYVVTGISETLGVSTITSYEKLSNVKGIHFDSSNAGIADDDEIDVDEETGYISMPAATETGFGLVKPDGETTFVENGVMSVPVATGTSQSQTLGLVKPDGTTLVVDEFGILSIPYATSSNLGVVRVDATTIQTDNYGLISAKKATSSTLGVVKPDNSTITVDSNGVIKSFGIQGITINGADTPALNNKVVFPIGSSSNYGAVKVDDTTLTASNGVITTRAVQISSIPSDGTYTRSQFASYGFTDGVVSAISLGKITSLVLNSSSLDKIIHVKEYESSGRPDFILEIDSDKQIEITLGSNDEYTVTTKYLIPHVSHNAIITVPASYTEAQLADYGFTSDVLNGLSDGSITRICIGGLDTSAYDTYTSIICSMSNSSKMFSFILFGGIFKFEKTSSSSNWNVSFTAFIPATVVQ